MWSPQHVLGVSLGHSAVSTGVCCPCPGIPETFPCSSAQLRGHGCPTADREHSLSRPLRIGEIFGEKEMLCCEASHSCLLNVETNNPTGLELLQEKGVWGHGAKKMNGQAWSWWWPGLYGHQLALPCRHSPGFPSWFTSQTIPPWLLLRSA